MADQLGYYIDRAGVRQQIVGVSIVGGGFGGPPVSPDPSGEPTDPVEVSIGGSYLFSANAEDWSGGEVVGLEFLLPKSDPDDPDTWASVTGPSGDAELTAPGVIGVVIGDGATIRVTNASNLVNLAWTLS